MKNSFVLYTDYMEQINCLNMEQRGVLFTAIMNYVSGEDLPDMDAVIKMAFSFIKAQLDRDSEKYNETCEKRREAGRKGGKASAKQRQANQANATFAEPKSSKTKQNQANQADNEDEYEDEDDNVDEYEDDISNQKNNTYINPLAVTLYSLKKATE